MEKPKFVIRYAAGSGGHFVGAVAWSLITDFEYAELIEQGGSNTKMVYEQYQNFYRFMDFGPGQQLFKKYINELADSELAIEWFSNFIEFYENPWPAYVATCHANKPVSLLNSIPQSRLINILIDINDFDQVAWNWVLKSYIHFDDSMKTRILAPLVNNLRSQRSVKVPKNYINDLKFVAWCSKFGMQDILTFYTQQVDVNQPSFTIKFTDLINLRSKTSLANRIDEFAEFLNIKLTDSMRVKCQHMLLTYCSKQPLYFPLNYSDY